MQARDRNALCAEGVEQSVRQCGLAGGRKGSEGGLVHGASDVLIRHPGDLNIGEVEPR